MMKISDWAGEGKMHQWEKKKLESKNTQYNAKSSICKSLRNGVLNTWFVSQEMIKL